MAFTKDYINICYAYRSIYRHKRLRIGDWFVNARTGEIRVYNGEPNQHFSGRHWFYLPDLDDLFEFLKNQIRAIQEKDVPPALIELRYTPEADWSLEIRTEEGLIHRSCKAKSPHEVIWHALSALSSFAVMERDPVKREKIFRMRSICGHEVWREPHDREPMVPGSRPVERRKMQRAKPGYFRPDKPSLLQELREACRAVARMWVGGR